MPALYLVIVSALVAIIAYRTYGAFLAAKVATLDDLRVTPAHTRRDGRDYVPTNRVTLAVAAWGYFVWTGTVSVIEPMPEAAV